MDEIGQQNNLNVSSDVEALISLCGKPLIFWHGRVTIQPNMLGNKVLETKVDALLENLDFINTHTELTESHVNLSSAVPTPSSLKEPTQLKSLTIFCTQ